MAQKPIREYHVKELFNKHWNDYFSDFTYPFKSVLVQRDTDFVKYSKKNKWLQEEPLVAKPDMLFGKRGINGLVLYKDQKPGDITLEKANQWVQEKAKGITKLQSGESGKLTHFIIEPFVPHTANEEYYIAATSVGLEDVLYLSTVGGVEIEEDWESKVSEIHIPIDASNKQIQNAIRQGVPTNLSKEQQAYFETFAFHFYRFFRDLHFAYLEINPIVIQKNKIYLLDAVARMDDTAGYMMKDQWGDLLFPTSFGMDKKCDEIKAIEEVDHNSGASLKLTMLHPKGRVWTLVAGGGASVVYADTIANMCSVEALANYGEYSGGPTTEETRFYASTLFDLMTRFPHPKGKILIIGGAIANFTDVAKTFDGIIQAMQTHYKKLKEHKVKIYVRRGGPNYQIGLDNIYKAAEDLGLYIEVYGPETHITDIVKMALA